MPDAAVWILLVLTGLCAIGLLVVLARFPSAVESVTRTLREDLRAAREEANGAARDSRDELSRGMKEGHAAVAAGLAHMATVQQAQLDSVGTHLKGLGEANQASLERIRTMIDARLKEIQEGNEKKLEEMRKTVDDKLHESLEKRLGESFKLVGDRLEAVHKGLGEMQTLAMGVGDLKRVLTNVKTRGTWGEVQLGAILEQVLAPGQYERNVRVKDGLADVVEYAIRLPGRKDEPDACVWLPIDSKFPQEDYLRVQEAADNGDAEAVQRAVEALARAVRLAGKSIHEKYLDPPRTTDFGIMFLATEGLYAEVLRQTALVDELQQRYRVVVAGPTTLAAVLSSLRIGFQTLAIEQRAGEVWKLLAAVKTEFGKFGAVLDRVKRQLDTASRTIDETGVRTRAMNRKLRAVEELPEDEATRVLHLPVSGHEPDVEDVLDGADGDEDISA